MIAIIGGGISGLSAAYQLKKANKDFVLLEANSTLGGKMGSYRKGGFTIETGPNTVLINNGEIKKLIEDLGLWERLISPNEEAVNQRFVLKNNQLEAIPTSLKAAFNSKLVKVSTILSVIKEPFQAVNSEEESLANFICRRLGKQILNDFITPFVTGIYAGDPEKMSSNYVLDILKEAEIKHGSVLKGMPKLLKAKKIKNAPLNLPKQKIFTFKNGLQDLVTAIESKIQPHVKYNSKVKQIERANGGYLIQVEGEELPLKADKIICCQPAFSAAKSLQNLSSQLSQNLLKIEYVPAVSVSIGVNRKDLDFNYPAFGILSRAIESVPFLGVLFNSRFFPHTSENKEKELITVIAGGSRNPEILAKSDAEIKEEILSSLRSVIGFAGKPDFIDLKRWKKGIPQYNLGYSEIEKSIETFLKENSSIKIAANYFKGVSVSDCIKNGNLAAKELI